MSSNNISNIEQLLNALDDLLRDCDRLLIVMHNNPDPDSMASALALRAFVKKRSNSRVSIGYEGIVGRAENRALVKICNIPLKRLNRIRIKSYDRIVLLDTQPGARNNSLPENTQCDLVIDHHPCRRGLDARYALIEDKVGATATLMIELLNQAEIPYTADLATSLAYAIRSETQDLGRETSPRDIKSYFHVYARASMKKLSRITRPKLEKEYFIALTKTLQKARTFRNLICSHVGDIYNPDLVAEMADFLLRQERISWTLVTGRFKGDLFLSIRSSNKGAKAGELIKKIVPDSNQAGGHDHFAGGKVGELSKDEMDKLETSLSSQFAERLGYKSVDWKPLLSEKERS